MEGKLIKSKEEIKADALPEAVKKAVEAKYPKGTIKEAKKIFKDNKLTYKVEMKYFFFFEKEMCLDEEGNTVKKD